MGSRIHREAYDRLLQTFGSEDGLFLNYPLDQNIGDPRAQGAEGDEICPGNLAAMGLIMKRNQGFDVTHLTLLCAPAPRGGAP